MDPATASDNCGDVTIEEVKRDDCRCLRWRVHDHSHVHGDRRLWQQHISYADDHGSRHDGT